MSGRWRVGELRGTAAEIHAVTLDEVLDGSGGGGELPVVTRAVIAEPAIVLGSAQRAEAALLGERTATGLAVVTRRSGGGAVLVTPGAELWVDVWLPAGDPLWTDDVGEAFHWLGDVWARVAARLGVDATVHRGPMQADALARRVCFVGVGPGEVLVGGRKLVGIAQRRTRRGARFQCAWIHRWEPDHLLEALAIDDPADRRRVVEAAAPVAAPPDTVWALLLAELTDH